MSLQQLYEVQVAIYDLSKGMARTLSAQFLGPNYQIDAIPHTGVIVYGMEYFFGGGIQCEEPAAFRRATGIMPIQVINVGRTHVTKAAFDAWCRQKMDSGEFGMQSYDLMNHNCNTFSHVALTQGLGLSQGVPQWILDVPQKFLSSPMGQMVRPMLDNMQLGRVDGAQTMASVTPFSSAAPSVAVAATNPWAQISSGAPISTESSSTTKTETGATTATANDSPSLDILSTHTKPLLANETRTVLTCVEKLIPLASGDSEIENLRVVGQGLAHQKVLPSDQTVHVSQFLKRCIESGQKTTFAMMLVRLLVLTNAASCESCLEWIVGELPKSDNGTLASAASRAMSWLTLSNAVADQYAPVLLEKNNLETLVETSLRDISPESQCRVEVRQAASAFIYNTVLTSQMQLSKSDSELSDLHVSILCAVLESLDLESDETVRLRRVLTAGRMLLLPNKTKQQRHRATAQLISDLGFQEGLEAYVRKSPNLISSKLAKEVLYVLSE